VRRLAHDFGAHEQHVLDDLGHLGGELKEQSLGEDRHVI
jgi:hypothetical protein